MDHARLQKKSGQNGVFTPAFLTFQKGIIFGILKSKTRINTEFSGISENFFKIFSKKSGQENSAEGYYGRGKQHRPSNYSLVSH